MRHKFLVHTQLAKSNLTFLETGLNALEKIDWYGETEFVYPICGYSKANAKRIKTPNKKPRKREVSEVIYLN